MAKINKAWVVAAAVLVAAGGYAKAQQKTATTPAAATQAYKTVKLDRKQIDALLAKPGELTIIDVRRPDELTRIGGFPVYLSIQNDDVEKNLAFIPKDRKIVTVSNHAGRALKIGDLLSSRGYDVVGAIGVQNYEEEGGKLTRIEPKAPATAAVTK